MLQMRENEISLRIRSGGTPHLHTLGERGLQKTALFSSNARFSFMLLFTQYKTVWLAPINSHCLVALRYRYVCVQWRSEAKCRPGPTIKVPPFPPL